MEKLTCHPLHFLKRIKIPNLTTSKPKNFKSTHSHKKNIRREKKKHETLKIKEKENRESQRNLRENIKKGKKRRRQNKSKKEKKMLESKDPAIKLFGMKIPFPTVFEVADEEDKNHNESLTDQSEKGKTLKKPTKILPCPRCNSMETKFCYYNNYNVNQPRYFCKACQRYWTSGGTMRSVPVGAGRRKNKNNNSSSSSHYRHVTISETNGPVLSFSLGDVQKVSTDNNVDDCSINESRTRNNKTNGLDGFPGVPWPYTWNPGFYPVYPYWSVPMLSSPVHSSPNSPVTTLGKHSRGEDETMQRKQKNGSVLVPKTLRIDDPNEAAKSSIWTTLGIKNKVMFKGFDSKKEVKIIDKEETETSLVLCANPAALSRSVNFHERI